MKHIQTLLLLGILSLSGFAQSAKATDVSFQFFYDSLASSGTWINLDDYGYCWQPTLDDPDWRPYYYGHWVYTDYGWTWVSDEPWGWAVYHYGRWVNIEGRGWFWVPGYAWAPAWVSWRYGGGYCGWAPLPPECRLYVSISFGTDFDACFHIGAGCYNFVPVRCMGERSLAPVIIHHTNNYTVINHTVNVTRIEHATHNPTVSKNSTHNTLENERPLSTPVINGPSLDEVNAQATHHVPQLKLERNDAEGPNAVGFRARQSGDSLNVFAPQVRPHVSDSDRPARVETEISGATVNRGTDPRQPLIATTGSPAPHVPQQAIHVAEQAQHHAPDNIPVANDAARTSPAPRITPENIQQPAFKSVPESDYKKPWTTAPVPAQSGSTTPPAYHPNFNRQAPQSYTPPAPAYHPNYSRPEPQAQSAPNYYSPQGNSGNSNSWHQGGGGNGGGGGHSYSHNH